MDGVQKGREALVPELALKGRRAGILKDGEAEAPREKDPVALKGRAGVPVSKKDGVQKGRKVSVPEIALRGR